MKSICKNAITELLAICISQINNGWRFVCCIKYIHDTLCAEGARKKFAYIFIRTFLVVQKSHFDCSQLCFQKENTKLTHLHAQTQISQFPWFIYYTELLTVYYRCHYWKKGRRFPATKRESNHSQINLHGHQSIEFNRIIYSIPLK